MFKLFHCIFHRNFCKQNRVDSDQTPRSSASELGLHCLHNTPKRISGLKSAEVVYKREYLLILHCSFSIDDKTSYIE